MYKEWQVCRFYIGNGLDEGAYPVDIPWFNDRVDTLNTFLRNYFKEDRVEGVQLVYSDDRVHLNELTYQENV
jgi:hypothetical protein